MEINSSIECEVNECQFNDTAADHCTLNKIKVEKSKENVTSIEATDCGSFKAK